MWGEPARSRRCSLYLNPLAKSALRTYNSGFVFTPLIFAISAERESREIRSVIRSLDHMHPRAGLLAFGEGGCLFHAL
jgi:hypothetical protein